MFVPDSHPPPFKHRAPIWRSYGAKAALGVLESQPDFSMAMPASMLPRSPETAHLETLDSFRDQIAACAYTRHPSKVAANVSEGKAKDSASPDIEAAYQRYGRFLTDTIEKDMEAWRSHRPVHSFTDKLEEAIKLDAEWERTSFKEKINNKEISFREMLDQMVQVEVKPSKSFRSTRVPSNPSPVENVGTWVEDSWGSLGRR